MNNNIILLEDKKFINSVYDDSTLLEDINYDINDSKMELLEDVDKGERIYMLKGVFARGNYVNLNKRVYPNKVLGEAYKLIKESMDNEGAMLVGENEHPDSGAKINMDRISCYFPELTFNEETGELSGIARPSSTPQGEILKGLMKDGIRVGFSTRCSGKVKPYRGPLGEGLVEVQPGLRLIAIDCVMNPSAKCFPKAIIESTEEESKYHFMSGVSNFKTIWETNFLGK